MKTGAMPDVTVLDLRDSQSSFANWDGKTCSRRRRRMRVATACKIAVPPCR
jgi:hypothetical protein